MRVCRWSDFKKTKQVTLVDLGSGVAPGSWIGQLGHVWIKQLPGFGPSPFPKQSVDICVHVWYVIEDAAA